MCHFLKIFQVRNNSEYATLIDVFIENAVELDVDLLCEGEDVNIGGILEHIQEAGIHSGGAIMATYRYFLTNLAKHRLLSILQCG